MAVPLMRAKVMAEYKRLVTKKDMQSFLGCTNYYRKFVKDYSICFALLHAATASSAPGKVVWTEECLAAFNHLRLVLREMCVLTVPGLQDVFSLHTDASAYLNVIRDGEEKPVGFFSKQLQGAHKRYSATELEGLAIFRAVFHYAHFLYGREFTIITDHKVLVQMMMGKALNRRVRGWALKLQDFLFKVVYCKGSKNGNADGLSRQAWTVDGTEMDATEDGRKEMWEGTLTTAEKVATPLHNIHS